MHLIGELSAVLATALFIFALYWMNDPKTARRGVIAGIVGMTVAVVATWIQPEIIHHGWIVGAIVLGFAVGVPLSRVPLTAVPQRTALSHAFGGLAAGLVGTAEYFLWRSGGAAAAMTPFRMSALAVEVILGFLTFTGSLMAAGKLQEVKWIPQRPVTYPGQNVVNIGVLAIAVGLGVAVALHPGAPWAQQAFLGIAALALLFGVLLIIPIGGADMPTVISILNAYAGLSAVAMGFVRPDSLDHHVPRHEPVVHERAVRRIREGPAGARRGRAEGVEAGDGRGSGPAARASSQRRHHSGLRDGGGAGPAQSSRAVRRADQAGHHGQVRDSSCHKSTPIYGMPIIDADKAKTVLAVKRSKKPGFAGIDNELYTLDNTWMLFGDAKAVLADLVKQFGSGGIH